MTDDDRTLEDRVKALEDAQAVAGAHADPPDADTPADTDTAADVPDAPDVPEDPAETAPEDAGNGPETDERPESDD